MTIQLKSAIKDPGELRDFEEYENYLKEQKESLPPDIFSQINNNLVHIIRLLEDIKNNTNIRISPS